AHLSVIIQKWKDSLNQVSEKTTLPLPQFPQSNYINETIAKSESIDDEEGIIDLNEKAKEALEKCNSIITQIAENLNDFSKTTDSYTEQVNKLTQAKASISSLKFLINQFSKVIYNFSRDLDLLANEYKIHTDLSLDSLTKLLVIYTDSEDSQGSIRDIIDAAIILSDSVNTALTPTISFLESIKNLPRMTTELNRSKKTLIKSLEQLIDYFKHTYVQYKEISDFDFKE
ncbi:hypothetical protein DZC41_04580, partial [Acinetobacter haemolyticus]